MKNKLLSILDFAVVLAIWIVALMLISILAHGQTAVQFNVVQFTGATNDTTINIKARNNPVIYQGQFYWQPYAGLSIATTNGQATTNLIPGQYTVTLAGIPQAWTITVTNSAATLNAASLTTDTVIYNGINSLTGPGVTNLGFGNYYVVAVGGTNSIPAGVVTNGQTNVVLFAPTFDFVTATNSSATNIFAGSVQEGISFAIGPQSHAEGGSTASAYAAHAEGASIASGLDSHAQNTSDAYGNYSSSSGDAQAFGAYSWAGGNLSRAYSNATFVWGDGSLAAVSTTNNQVAFQAQNGFLLLGGPITGNGAALTNLPASSIVGLVTAGSLVDTNASGLYLSDNSGVSVLLAAPPAVTLPYVLLLPSDIQVTNTGYVKFTVTNILGTNYLSLYLSPQ